MKEDDLPIFKSIQTKYVITADKTMQSNLGKTVNLKKGDIIQGTQLITSGNLANDSGSEQLVFKDKDNNIFQIQIGYRGFQPFFEGIKDTVQRTNPKDAGIYYNTEEKFWRSLGLTQSDMISPTAKGRFYLVIALVAGYFAYKKFKK